jgi:hypothetical protein
MGFFAQGVKKMATAEKMFPLTVTRPVPIHSDSDRESGFSQSLANFANRVFGCWHRELSRPFTRQGQTFRTCLGCGARREFDLSKWENKGGFYRAAA